MIAAQLNIGLVLTIVTGSCIYRHYHPRFKEVTSP